MTRTWIRDFPIACSTHLLRAPDFPEKKYPITVRQVAGHTAGIRHYKGNEFLSDKYYATVREGLTIFENDPLLFEPDTDYSYSSYGWNLVSAIVEGASGEICLMGGFPSGLISCGEIDSGK